MTDTLLNPKDMYITEGKEIDVGYREQAVIMLRIKNIIGNDCFFGWYA